MRRILRPLGRRLLKILTKLVIAKHRPTIIGIVGDGETGVCRELVFGVLNQKHPARRNLESPSVEFSLPLCILGVEDYPTSLRSWAGLSLKVLRQLLTVRPYPHFLILELSPALKETLDYWLSITQPHLLIICGTVPDLSLQPYKTLNITKPTLAEIKKSALTAGRLYGVDTELSQRALEKITFYPSRIRFFPGQNGRLIIDATYYYYPIPLQSVLELVKDLPEPKLLISDEKIEQMPPGFQVVPPNNFRETPAKIVIIRGKRTERFELLEQLIEGDYE